MKFINWIKAHPYMVAILYGAVYFPLFFLLEKFREPQYFIHCFLDDYIPFIEAFIIPYLLWFLLVPTALFYFMKYSREDYYKLCMLIFGGMSICLLLYLVFPNGLTLREIVVQDNLLSKLTSMLYSVDTPTNVCPSIHVSSTVGIHLVVQNSAVLKDRKKIRIMNGLLTILICMSTVFLKQHSIIDVICGIALSACLYVLIYKVNFKALRNKHVKDNIKLS